MAKKQVAVSLRKPPSPESLDAFVSAGADPPADEVRPASQPLHSRAAQPKQAEPATVEQTPAVLAESPARTEPITVNATVEVTPAPSVVGWNGVPLRPVTVYLPQAMAERLTLHCIEQDRDASNVIGEALELHLSRRLGPGAAPPAPARPQAEWEGARSSASTFWSEVPFGQRDGWPGRRIEQLFEIGRLLVGMMRRRGYAG